tara:strand:+ start:2066 stop:2329 length:264 start_codon:yes stop_codon:yes gene_type:complete
MKTKVKSEIKWNYPDDTLDVLSTLLFQRIEFDYVTLTMTEDEYALFYVDVDDETLVANRFRMLDFSNECNPVWLFDGKLKVNIKIRG